VSGRFSKGKTEEFYIKNAGIEADEENEEKSSVEETLTDNRRDVVTAK